MTPTPPPAAAGRDPAAAVERFLTALRAGNDAASFALLTDGERRRLGSVAAWRGALTGRTAISSFAVTETRRDPSGTGDVDVTVRVSRAPSLDRFDGLTPGTAIEVWRTTPVAGGWLVQPDPIGTTVVLPHQALATAAVQRWVDTAARCGNTAPLLATVIPDSALLREPCTAGGTWRAGAALRYADVAGTEAVIAAFGPDAATWARFVPVSGPGDDLIVGVAPFDADWRVMAVLSVPPGEGAPGG